MIRLERTFDLGLVRSTMTHPRLYPSLSSDFSPSPEEFEPNPAPSVHFMAVYVDEVYAGLFITHSIMNPLIWELHHCLLPHAWRLSHEIGEAFESWLWANTTCQTAVGFTPVCNKLALRYADKRGMVRSGVIPQGYRKGGIIYDMVVFTKHKPSSL